MKRAFLILAIMLILPMAASKIVFLTNPDQIYNVGDTISVDFSIQPDATSYGYVESYLDCGGNKDLFFKEYNSLLKGEQKDFSLSLPAQSPGNCTLETDFKNENEKSNSFKISDKSKVDFSMKSKNVLPLEKILINGTVTKENSQLLDGLASIEIGKFQNATIDVDHGRFSLEFEIPKEAPPGNYTIKIYSYEKNFDGKKINQGFSEDSFFVKSKPTFIKLESEEEIKPPFNLNIKSTLLDQVNNYVPNESIIVKIFDPENNLVFQDAKKSGNSFNYFFQGNASRGAWKIISYYGSISSTKHIYVDENKAIDIGFENGSSYAKIKNIGNIYYEKVIELTLKNGSQNFTIPLNINLSIGDEEIYPLKIKGTYNISVEDKSFSNVHLAPITGAVIGSGNNKGYYILAFALILVLVGAFIIFKKRKNLFKKNLFEKTNESGLEPKKDVQEGSEKNENKYYKGTFKSESVLKKSVPQNRSVYKKPEKVEEKEEKKITKKIYSIFFNAHFEEINSILKRKKYELHTMGSKYHFVIIRQEKDSVHEVLKIAKEIYSDFPDTGVLVNSKDFEGNVSSIRSLFIPKQIVESLKGIFITESFFETLKKPLSTLFFEYKSFKVKERIIKLFALKNMR